MKTIADIRHENLLKLIDECGSVTKFAAATGKSYAQISQLKNRSLNSTGKGKPRSVGDDLAREFEKIAHDASFQIQTIQLVAILYQINIKK